MDFMNFIMDEGLILIPFLYIVGVVIKDTGALKNKWIPLILLGISIGFTPLVIGGYSADSIVQAVLIAGVTVFGDQLIKQTGKGEWNG